MKLHIINLVEFKDWFLEKFVEWRGKTTNGPTAYARYLGIKQQAVNDWLQGKYIPKSHEHITRLAELYPEVYTVLGMEGPPDPLTGLPDDFARRVRLAGSRIRNAIEQGEVSPGTPEYDKFVTDTMREFGFISTNNP
jgi:hypothetical protein